MLKAPIKHTMPVGTSFFFTKFTYAKTAKGAQARQRGRLYFPCLTETLNRVHVCLR